MEKQVTYRYVKDGQERIITGTQAEIDAEIAGVPFKPVEEQPMEEQPMEEQPMEEQPMEEQPMEEQPMEEHGE